MEVDEESISNDEEDVMGQEESDEEERSSTPALAIVTGPHRGDTPPIITFGPNGFPVTKKRRGSGSGASRSFDVGLSRNRR